MEKFWKIDLNWKFVENEITKTFSSVGVERKREIRLDEILMILKFSHQMRQFFVKKCNICSL